MSRRRTEAILRPNTATLTLITVPEGHFLRYQQKITPHVREVSRSLGASWCFFTDTHEINSLSISIWYRMVNNCLKLDIFEAFSMPRLWKKPEFLHLYQWTEYCIKDGSFLGLNSSSSMFLTITHVALFTIRPPEQSSCMNLVVWICSSLSCGLCTPTRSIAILNRLATKWKCWTNLTGWIARLSLKSFQFILWAPLDICATCRAKTKVTTNRLRRYHHFRFTITRTSREV